VLAPFLGEAAEIDLAPALIAMRARAPLAAVFARRLPDGTHVAELAGVIEPPEHPSRAWAEQAMTTVTEWLETFVRRHPEQWLWMHRRWKRTSAGVVASASAWTASPGETPHASPTAASP
jgi:KDO2-lipid IV(A) lauroyltransferase